MSSYTNIFSGFNVQPSQSSYSSYVINANLTLVWPLQFIDTTNVVSNIIDVNAVVGALTVKMPDATQAGIGNSVIFNNVGANTFSVIKNNNNNLVTLLAGQSAFVYLTDNTTIAGTWRTTPFGGGFVAVTSVGAVSTSNNLTIAGSPITNAGTFTFSLANDLLELSNFGGGTGIAVRTAANVWALRNVVGTANQISVVNGAGTLGDITLSLPVTITGINNLTVGNINLTANTIITTNANGDMNFIPNGTGANKFFKNVSLLRFPPNPLPQMLFYNVNNNGYVGLQGGNSALGSTTVWTLPLVDGAAGNVIQTNGAGTLGWTAVVNFNGPSTNNAIAKYQGIAGALQNSGVIIDPANNITGANSIISQNIRFAFTGSNTIDIANANGSLNLLANGNGNITLTTTAPGETQNSGILTMRPSGANPTPIRFYNGANTFYSSFQAGNPGANVTWTLPSVDGGISSLLSTNAAGILGWTPAGAGKLVLISSQVAANSAAIIFSANTATFPVYNTYYLIVKDLIPQNNDVNLYIQFYTDGGVNPVVTNYYFSFPWSDSAGNILVANAFNSNVSQIVPIRDTAGVRIPNAATIPNAPYNADFVIYNANSGNYTSMTSKVQYKYSTGIHTISMAGGASLNSAVIVNGIKLFMGAANVASGNIAAGTFTLYGLNT